MKLSSPAFENLGEIPRKYSCQGQDISPPMKIENAPNDAISLVLIMDDPDIPLFVKEKFNIQKWDHWTLFNIDPKTKEIPEGKNPGMLGKNTNGNNAYRGPCPPDRRHRYFFRLYAIDCILNLTEGATKQQVLDAIKEHVIAEAELVGTYEKETSEACES